MIVINRCDAVDGGPMMRRPAIQCVMPAAGANPAGPLHNSQISWDLTKKWRWPSSVDPDATALGPDHGGGQ